MFVAGLQFEGYGNTVDIVLRYPPNLVVIIGEWNGSILYLAGGFDENAGW